MKIKVLDELFYDFTNIVVDEEGLQNVLRLLHTEGGALDHRI